MGVRNPKIETFHGPQQNYALPKTITNYFMSPSVYVHKIKQIAIIDGIHFPKGKTKRKFE